jgi:hypothetical protein
MIEMMAVISFGEKLLVDAAAARFREATDH